MVPLVFAIARHSSQWHLEARQPLVYALHHEQEVNRLPAQQYRARVHARVSTDLSPLRPAPPGRTRSSGYEHAIVCLSPLS